MGETKVVTSVVVKEGSLGPRVPVNWGPDALWAMV
jgi:hypothetical protein